MGKKYIIELCEKPMKNENGDDIWRVKGFNTLVFDQNGLDKLEEYKEPVTHKFEVGDVCRWKYEYVLFTRNDKIFITKITDQYVEYLTKTGDRGSMLRGVFERSADFVNHSTIFKVLSVE